MMSINYRRWRSQYACPLRLITSLIIIIFITSPRDSGIAQCQAAHARKRPTINPLSRKRQNEDYDKSITTFSPEGRLLQIDYAQESSNRGSTTVAFHIQPGSSSQSSQEMIVIIHVSSSSNPFTQQQKVHRLDDSSLAIYSGLEGDGGMLVRHLRNFCARDAWNRGEMFPSVVNRHISSHQDTEIDEKPKKIFPIHWGTTSSIDHIARECGRVQHSLTLTPGARPLGISTILLGRMDKSNYSIHSNRKLGLFHCLAGGHITPTGICCTGYKNEDVMNELERVLDTLLSDIHHNNNDEDLLDIGEYDYTNGHYIRELIKRSCSTILQKQKSADNSELKVRNGQDAIDIYIMKPNSLQRGGVEITCAKCILEQDLDHVMNKLKL